MAEMYEEDNDDDEIQINEIESEESDCSLPPEDTIMTDLITENTYSYSPEVMKEINQNFRNGFEKFTEEDYQTLQQNIIMYKQGNLEAATYIISMFHQFVSKYARFICYGKISKEDKEFQHKEAGYDKSISRFVALFMSPEKNNSGTDKKDKYKTFAETCGKVCTLFSKFEYCDIYNELVCALLNMANKYKITQEGDKYHHKNGSFHMYVSKCFHFEAHNVLSKLIYDPLAHTETYHIYEDNLISDVNLTGVVNKMRLNGESANENVASVNHSIKAYYLKDTDSENMLEHLMEKTDRKNALKSSDNLVLNEKNEMDPYDVESLNFNWTNGTTCGELFECLTSYERELVILSFIKNKTDSEIASIYGCHRVTIVNHKKEAVRKIKKAALNKKMID
jgi:uncharacterized protein (UPF0248 family)